jgi:hypothetical protein
MFSGTLGGGDLPSSSNRSLHQDKLVSQSQKGVKVRRTKK